MVNYKNESIQIDFDTFLKYYSTWW